MIHLARGTSFHPTSGNKCGRSQLTRSSGSCRRLLGGLGTLFFFRIVSLASASFVSKVRARFVLIPPWSGGPSPLPCEPDPSPTAEEWTLEPRRRTCWRPPVDVPATDAADPRFDPERRSGA
jgi:hypothetical protein